MSRFNIPDLGIPSGALIIIAIIAVVYLIFKIFDISIKLFFKFLINALIGAALLFLFNYVVGDLLHHEELCTPINWLSATITGILGVPGVVIMILHRFISK